MTSQTGQRYQVIVRTWFAGDIPLTTFVHLLPFASYSRKIVFPGVESLLADEFSVRTLALTSYLWSEELFVHLESLTSCLHIWYLTWRVSLDFCSWMTSQTGKKVTTRKNSNGFLIQFSSCLRPFQSFQQFCILAHSEIRPLEGDLERKWRSNLFLETDFV